jgi:hypothetical protein
MKYKSLIIIIYFGYLLTKTEYKNIVMFFFKNCLLMIKTHQKCFILELFIFKFAF